MRFLINLRTVIHSAVGIFSYICILTVLAQTWHMVFRTYVVLALSGVFVYLICIYTVRQRWKVVDLPFFGSSVPHIPRWHVRSVIGISVLYGIISVIFVRPNPDDYYAYSNAFFAVAHPDLLMSFDIHSILPLDTPFHSVRWDTSGPYEYFVAALAHTMPIPFLSWTYIYASFFNGVSFAIVLYYSIVILTGTFRSAFHGFIVVAFMLLVLGVSDYSPLHHTLLRFSQDDAVFYAVGVPLFLVESYILLRSPRLRNMVIVSSTMIAAVSLTTSGYLLVLLMNCIVMVAIFSFVTYERLAHPQWILLWINASAVRLSMLLCSALPVIGYWVFLLRTPTNTPPTALFRNTELPVDMWGQAGMFLSAYVPVTAIDLIIAFILAGFVLPPPLRRMVILFYAVLTLGYLNPLTASSFILSSTQPTTSAGVFYLAVPLVFIGVIVASVSKNVRRRVPRWRNVITTTMLLGNMVLLIDAPSSLFHQTQEFSLKRVREYGFAQALWN